MIKIISFPFKIIIIGIIKIYKILISPILPKNCCYKPTCSTYAIQSINEWGIIRGSVLAIKRIISCNPKSKGGVQLVPQNIKGVRKWIY